MIDKTLAGIIGVALGLVLGIVGAGSVAKSSPIFMFGRCYVDNRHNELVTDAVMYCEGKANIQEIK